MGGISNPNNFGTVFNFNNGSMEFWDDCVITGNNNIFNIGPNSYVSFLNSVTPAAPLSDNNTFLLEGGSLNFQIPITLSNFGFTPVNSVFSSLIKGSGTINCAGAIFFPPFTDGVLNLTLNSESFPFFNVLNGSFNIYEGSTVTDGTSSALPLQVDMNVFSNPSVPLSGSW